MKVVVVFGSARNEGASTKVTKQLIRGMREAGHEIVEYHVGNMNIKGCMGCGFCRNNQSDCCQKDDMVSYWKDLKECGALVLATPNYYGHIAGPMVTFMNRHYCMTNADRSSRLPKKIKLYGIFSQGAPAGFSQYDTEYDWYLKTFLARNMELGCKIVVGGDSDLSEKGTLMTETFELGKALS